MGEDDAGAAVKHRIGDDLTEWETSLPRAAAVTSHVKTSRLIVDVRDPQAFAPRVGIGDAAREERPGRGKAIELQREFGTLIPHGVGVGQRVAASDSNRVRNGTKMDMQSRTWTQH
jgi:hypothetical protein